MAVVRGLKPTANIDDPYGVGGAEAQQDAGCKMQDAGCRKGTKRGRPARNFRGLKPTANIDDPYGVGGAARTGSEGVPTVRSPAGAFVRCFALGLSRLARWPEGGLRKAGTRHLVACVVRPPRKGRWSVATGFTPWV